LTILRNCRRAMPTGSRVIFEPILFEGAEAGVGAALDLVMLVTFGGRLRTEADLGELLDAAGLRLTRIILAPPLALAEAVPAAGPGA
jgi:hypothetical protein